MDRLGVIAEHTDWCMRMGVVPKQNGSMDNRARGNGLETRAPRTSEMYTCRHSF